MINFKIAIAVLAFFVATAATAATAATLYVDVSFGDDISNPDCKKKSPCKTIQHAITNGGNNARIIVSPGFYYENLVVNSDNVKIYSIAGARTTAIFSTDPGSDIVAVNGNGFVLGAKGKGFRMDAYGDTDSSSQGGISVYGDKAKIEGNQISGMDFSQFNKTEAAIDIEGNNATIRYNQLNGFKYGIGLFSDPLGKSNNLVKENSIRSMGSDCIFISHSSSGNDKVENNLIDTCVSTTGIFPDEDFDYGDGISIIYDDPAVLSKPKIQTNVVTRVDRGIAIESASPQIKNNFIDLNSAGSDPGKEFNAAIYLYDTDKAKVSNNFLQFSKSAIFVSFDNANIIFADNVIFQSSHFMTIEQNSVTPFRLVSSNNIVNSYFDCIIVLADDDYSAGPIILTKNFWGNIADESLGYRPDLSTGFCAATNADVAQGNNSLRFINSAATPNTIKYKGGL